MDNFRFNGSLISSFNIFISLFVSKPVTYIHFQLLNTCLLTRVGNSAKLFAELCEPRHDKFVIKTSYILLVHGLV
jgi:hypothetical protein